MHRTHRFVTNYRKCLLGGLLTLSILLMSGSTAQAYDYLEHSFLGDRACLDAQTRLAARIEAGDASYETMTRYLALGLVCPERWERRYCEDGYKQAEAGLNRLSGPPAESEEIAATFGDFVALPDHLSRYGPVRGLPRLGRFGLAFNTWKWLTADDGDAGGVIGAVAHKACQDSEMVPWRRVEADIEVTLNRFDKHGLEAVPGNLLSPLTHAPVPTGPSDPSAIYSFINPHYLDLVLRNHDHFGKYSFGAWLGFHSAAVSTARYTCEDLIDFSVDQLEDLADDMPEYSAIDWGGLSETIRAQRGCDMMRESVHKRLLEWQRRADPKLVAPVQSMLAALLADDAPQNAAPRRALLDGVSAATTSLVLEGVGLHFLQDGLAAGHMRTIRAKGQLEVVRYEHNSDNKNGVVALLQTRSGEYPFLAYGDTYMLGPQLLPSFVDCNWNELAHGTPSPRLVTNCLLQHQRGLLIATSSASLVDWALDGTLYEAPNAQPSGHRSSAGAARDDNCANPDALINFVCRTLPARATVTPGLETNSSEAISMRMQHGSIPVPPPPFAYQSLMIDIGLEATGDASQLGVHVNLLEELDSRANWLVSHSIGARTTLGDSNFNQISLDYAYSFHWRWAARFSIDARNSVFTGIKHLNVDPTFFAGLAPGVGMTLLPEGWTKLPLEMSLSYRLPLNFFSSDGGFFADDIIGGHWIIFGLGLAYM
ncbi:hypothetical protein [Bradymonas sediminis]|uniref:Uncharacterized protein n=1 Tax=Bradymonas sediminis TaxID=1548548 RepID=A0A2Z4FP11_9DELT|nr:hypothetical protein [Bradymonas sediminis]AWV90610.1 hypothetical protein DN745_15270 [Bradymonas sediminis]TDP62392.1 hypothetical protein DFR33_11355 [Bradymonas sediminis]